MDLGPLSGFRVGVTADRRWEEQVELLRRRGARSIVAPAIRTLPLSPEEGTRAAIESLLDRPPAVVVLTTGLGVRSWFAVAESLGLGEALLEALRPARVLTRGPKAAGAAVTAGLEVEWHAPSERSEELVAHLDGADLRGARVAVQLDGRDHPVLGDAIAALGAEVVPVPVYRWTLPADTGPLRRLIEAVCERRVDAVTFTAAPAVRNLFALAGEVGRVAALQEALQGGVVPVCVGPVCAGALVAAGVTSAVQPDRSRLGAMVQALAEHFSGRCTRLLLDGGELVVQGSAAVVGGELVELTDRERDVLAVLTERPGAVISKATLLARVWGADDADEHTVEVTVARLRRRLGPAGDALETAIRRGYRLALAST